MDTASEDPFLASFFGRIPPDVAASFTDAQLDAVKRAFGARTRGSHAIDIRLSIPLVKRRLYVVLLAGKERRPAGRLALERALRPLWALANAAVILSCL